MMRGATPSLRSGQALVELITVLFVLGVMAGVSGLAVASLRPPTDSARNQRLDQARAAAVRSGKAGSVTLEKGVLVRFLPDGRAIGAGVDPLTGEVVDASQ